MKQALWLKTDGAGHDVVLSTRFRLARNLRDFVFPARADRAVRHEIRSQFERAIHHEFPHWSQLRADQISPLTRELLYEKHLISHHLRDHPDGALVAQSVESRFVLMVNEEDHLRVQLLLPGLDLKPAWPELLRVGSRFELWMDYAVHPKFGYLTSCATNIGTGLRASVMLHLPALSWLNSLDRTLSEWPDEAIEFRGTFGEGTEAVASFVQLSNRYTLGSSVEEIVERVSYSTQNLVELERQQRHYLLHNYRSKVEDSVHRSLATLGAARLMDSREAANLLGTVRLGACLGLLPQFPPKTMLRLLVESRPAHLQYKIGQILRPEERDEWRASYIRSQIETLGEDKDDG